MLYMIVLQNGKEKKSQHTFNIEIKQTQGWFMMYTINYNGVEWIPNMKAV